MKSTLTFLFASCLLMLMACYRNNKQPDRAAQSQLGHTGNLDSVFVDTSNTLNYSFDGNTTWLGQGIPLSCYLVRDEFGKTIIAIPADTSYIEFYGKRFWPRKRAVRRKIYFPHGNIWGDSPYVDEGFTWHGDSITQNIFYMNDSGNIIKDSVIKRPNYIFYGDTISNVTIDSNWLKAHNLGVTTPGNIQPRYYGKVHFDTVRPKPSPIPDSIPKPTYEYVYKTTIPINQLQPTLDTINLIMENFGIDMMGSRSKAFKELMARKVDILLGRIVVDSVKVQEGKR